MCGVDDNRDAHETAVQLPQAGVIAAFLSCTNSKIYDTNLLLLVVTDKPSA